MNRNKVQINNIECVQQWIITNTRIEKHLRENDKYCNEQILSEMNEALQAGLAKTRVFFFFLEKTQPRWVFSNKTQKTHFKLGFLEFFSN